MLYANRNNQINLEISLAAISVIYPSKHLVIRYIHSEFVSENMPPYMSIVDINGNI